MKRKRRSIYDVVEYTPEQAELNEWRRIRMLELGLIPDITGSSINSIKDDKEVKLTTEAIEELKNNIIELSELENIALNYLDNYQEVPAEIKNRIFELRRMIKV